MLQTLPLQLLFLYSLQVFNMDVGSHILHLLLIPSLKETYFRCEECAKPELHGPDSPSAKSEQFTLVRLETLWWVGWCGIFSLIWFTVTPSLTFSISLILFIYQVLHLTLSLSLSFSPRISYFLHPSISPYLSFALSLSICFYLSLSLFLTSLSFSLCLYIYLFMSPSWYLSLSPYLFPCHFIFLLLSVSFPLPFKGVNGNIFL